jgi:ribosome-binding protein aMBF1 (putative translation factor)
MVNAESDGTKREGERIESTELARVEGSFRYLAEAIRIHRMGRELSREALALRCGLGVEAITAFEDAEALPSLQELQQLMNGLGVNLTQLSRLLSMLGESVRLVETGGLPGGTFADIVRILEVLEKSGVLSLLVGSVGLGPRADTVPRGRRAASAG